jgi:hypothetical protein
MRCHLNRFFKNKRERLTIAVIPDHTCAPRAKRCSITRHEEATSKESLCEKVPSLRLAKLAVAKKAKPDRPSGKWERSQAGKELLRHSDIKASLDVYARAMTPAKLKAQGWVLQQLLAAEVKSRVV